MTFRTRLTIALVAVALIPLVILGLGMRSEMTKRLDAESTRRLNAVSRAAMGRVHEQLAATKRRLESLAEDLAADNRFRGAVSGPSIADRRWLLDWAPTAMKSAGFTMLVVQDSSGRILSSGQFRNDYDRGAPVVTRTIESTPMLAAVIDARTPQGGTRALASMVTFRVRGERFTVAGGERFDSATIAALSVDPTIAAVLVIGGVDEGVVPQMTLPWLDETRDVVESARIVLVPDSAPMRALKADVASWLALTLGGALIAALLVASTLGRLMSAPLTHLARRAATIDIDRLDTRFSTGRSDEIGALEGTLDGLTMRLRAGAARLRATERAAVTGDLARQVNHDVKNGLAPIRNVIRHLSQVSEKDPAALPTLYAERRSTLEAGIDYLEQLARNFARLSPALTRGPTDARPVVLDVARARSGTVVDVRLPENLPRVRADVVVLRRILENLVSNAADAVDGTAGMVTITATSVNGSEPRVRLTVADSGRGMSRRELEQAFNDFYTTKPSGTGLGLTVVRRLLTDIGGSVRAETAPGRGSAFTVEIPAEVGAQ